MVLQMHSATALSILVSAMKNKSFLFLSRGLGLVLGEQHSRGCSGTNTQELFLRLRGASGVAVQQQQRNQAANCFVLNQDSSLHKSSVTLETKCISWNFNLPKGIKGFTLSVIQLHLWYIWAVMSLLSVDVGLAHPRRRERARNMLSPCVQTVTRTVRVCSHFLNDHYKLLKESEIWRTRRKLKRREKRLPQQAAAKFVWCAKAAVWWDLINSPGVLPGYPASGPVCARALHAKKLWKADALDNAAGDDTDDGIWSVRARTSHGLTPLYLAYMRTWPMCATAWHAGSTRLAPYHPFSPFVGVSQASGSSLGLPLLLLMCRKSSFCN